jgi:putative ABC transport system substrate-binding protein
MRRRDVLAGVLAGAVAPATGLAQGARPPSRIGFLGLGSPRIAESRLGSLRAGLDELGLRDGREYVIEARVVGPEPEILGVAAGALVASRPDILVTHATGTAALKRATGTIPIVMVSGDAVTAGLVDSLQKPGGNVTGISFLSPELMGKRFELLKELLPGIADAGLLALGGGYAVSGTVVQSVELAAKALGVRLHPVLVRNGDEIDPAFSELAARGVTGVVVQDEPMLIANARRIADAAAARRIASVGFLDLAVQGGEAAYSIDFDDVWRRSARFVARILQGARPQDLPVEQPTRFEFVLNLKALTLLGLNVSPSLVARADKVIE